MTGSVEGLHLRAVAGHAPTGKHDSDEEQAGKERGDRNDRLLWWHEARVPPLASVISTARDDSVRLGTGSASMGAVAEMAQTY